jgi:DNA mismatch repair ATPase MutL
MTSTTTDMVKEIAEQLDCGFRAFIHKTTGQILFVPDENNLTEIDLDPWDEELEQLENNFTDYHEIDKWTSSEAFETMSEFANQLTDISLQSRLFDALKKNKPFREFKFVIDNSGDFRQQWFNFKNKWQQDFVARQLNTLKPTDE